MTNYDRRLNRLAKLLPDQTARLGCRRVDHELRAEVDNVPEDVENREEILANRRIVARKKNPHVGSRVRITADSGYCGQEGLITGTMPPRCWQIKLDTNAYPGLEFNVDEFEVIG